MKSLGYALLVLAMAYCMGYFLGFVVQTLIQFAVEVTQ